MDLQKPKYNWTSISLVLLLIIGFGLQIYFLYFGYIYYGYLVSPGGDVVPHLNMAESVLKNGLSLKAGYPPLFHFIVVKLSQMFNVDILHILSFWTPILAVMPAMSMYFLLRQIFDQKISTISTLILLLTSQYPLFAFVDGNYPDMLAYGVFAILLFGFVIRYYKTQKIANLVIALALLILIAFTHNLTFVSVLTILVLFGLLQIILTYREHGIVFDWKKITIFSLVILTLGISVYFAFKMYGGLAVGFISGVINNKAYLADDFLNKTPDFTIYPSVMGNLVWYLGLTGLMFVLVSSFTKTVNIKTKQLVIIWFLFYFLLSRISSVGVPARFARELAPPLIICIGFLLNGVFSIEAKKHRFGLFAAYGLIGFLIITNSALYSGLLRLPEGFKSMVWFTKVDQQKVDYIKSETNNQDIILYNQRANQFTPIKLENQLQPLELTKEEIDVVKNFQKNEAFQVDIDLLVSKKTKQYKDISYIFVDKKPSTNPDEKVYPNYANYEQYSIALEQMAKGGEVVKTFSDGASLVKVDFNRNNNQSKNKYYLDE